MTRDEINNAGSYHPATPQQSEIYDEIRGRARDFAHRLHELLPESTEKEHALEKLLGDVVFHANAAVARHS